VTFAGKQTINHPFGLATVAQAGVIRETLKLAIRKADSAGAEDGKEKQEGGG
jgi:hypothetical protein